MFAQQDQLDWNVVSRPLVAVGVNGELLTVPGKVAQVRDDNDSIIGITGKDYTIFQNSDLKDIVSPLVEEGLLEINNIGYLKGGSKVFIQAQMTEEYRAAGDAHRGSITLLNAHDGTAALAAGVTATRVICTNTFTTAMSEMGTRFRHNSAIHDNAANITAIVEFVNENMRIYSEAADKLALTTATDEMVDSVIEAAYNKPIESVRAANKIKQFYRYGIQTEGKSLWDAFNAVTQYTNHNAVKDDGKRLGSVTFGRNANVNRRALDAALALV